MDVRMDRVYVGTKAKVEGTRIDRRQWQREAGRDGSRGRRRREGPAGAGDITYFLRPKYNKFLGRHVY
jgi:hypothetical protein